MSVLTRPRAALARVFAAAGRSLMPSGVQSAYYKGARIDRFSGDWSLGQVSPTQILRSDLTTIVDRTRDLVMNNTTAARIPTLFAENISGKDGITYQAAVQFANGNMNERANNALESSWYRWAEDKALVSADRRMCFFELEELLDKKEPVDGETFVRVLVGHDNAYRFALHFLHSDQIDRKYNDDARPGRNAIVMGVEIDAWGGAVAYHVWPNHPGEVSRRGQRMRIPADQIIHRFIVQEPGQVRGVPWFAPTIAELQHLGEYSEAEVVAARASAAKMGFIETDGEMIQPASNAPNRPLQWDVAPGTIEQLSPGQSFKEWNPLHPNGNFESFERTIVRRIATALRVSYMSLSGDMTQTSYASGRLGFLAERMVYQMLAQRKVRDFHRPVHRLWLRQALLTGQIDYPSFDAEMLSASVWHPRAFPGIDVQKETDAADHKVAMGLKTLTALAAEDGLAIEDIARERAQEIAIFKRYGVPIHLMNVPKAATPADGAPPAATTDDATRAAALTLVEDAA